MQSEQGAQCALISAKHVAIIQLSLSCFVRFWRGSTVRKPRRKVRREQEQGIWCVPSRNLLHCCWKWPFIADFPVKMVIFPTFVVCLPEGNTCSRGLGCHNWGKYLPVKVPGGHAANVIQNCSKSFKFDLCVVVVVVVAMFSVFSWACLKKLRTAFYPFFWTIIPIRTPWRDIPWYALCSDAPCLWGRWLAELSIESDLRSVWAVWAKATMRIRTGMAIDFEWYLSDSTTHDVFTEDSPVDTKVPTSKSMKSSQAMCTHTIRAAFRKRHLSCGGLCMNLSARPWLRFTLKDWHFSVQCLKCLQTWALWVPKVGAGDVPSVPNATLICWFIQHSGAVSSIVPQPYQWQSLWHIRWPVTITWWLSGFFQRRVRRLHVRLGVAASDAVVTTSSKLCRSHIAQHGWNTVAHSTIVRNKVNMLTHCATVGHSARAMFSACCDMQSLPFLWNVTTVKSCRIPLPLLTFSSPPRCAFSNLCG